METPAKTLHHMHSVGVETKMLKKAQQNKSMKHNQNIPKQTESKRLTVGRCPFSDQFEEVGLTGWNLNKDDDSMAASKSISN